MNELEKILSQYKKPILIAEVGQAHDGSLGYAHSFIDIVADSGFDAIKFQTHIADSESTKDEMFRVNFSYEDEFRYDYWKRMEFSKSQWEDLANHAHESGLMFLSSVFSTDAVDLLTDIKIPMWKVGSGEFLSFELIDKLIETKKPILISTGMSSWSEIDRMVDYIRNKKSSVGVFQCTSQYPTPLDKVGINIIQEINDRYDCSTGLSDHSGSVWPSILAISRGVSFIEVHVANHKKSFGPDTPASLTPDELLLISKARDAIIQMDSHPVDKSGVDGSLKNVRQLFTKSIAFTKDMKKGSVITSEVLTMKKPGNGLPTTQKNNLIGKVLNKDVNKNILIKYEDVEQS